MKYRVIEVTPVDESSLEEAVNRQAEQGWELERIEFVQQGGVRRPVMAYLFFVRVGSPTGEGS